MFIKNKHILWKVYLSFSPPPFPLSLSLSRFMAVVIDFRLAAALGPLAYLAAAPGPIACLAASLGPYPG